MKRSILIVDAGKGLSVSTAFKFGREGFTIGLISRDAAKLAQLTEDLKAENISVFYESADVMDNDQLAQAITSLKQKMENIDVLLYNAAALKQKDILEVDFNEFAEDFQVNVWGALRSVQLLQEELTINQGTILLTGGGFATEPSPNNGTLSIGKAGIKNLAFQLHERLKPRKIYVGTLTVTATISSESDLHNPDALAGTYWQMFMDRSDIEVII